MKHTKQTKWDFVSYKVQILILEDQWRHAHGSFEETLPSLHKYRKDPLVFYHSGQPWEPPCSLASTGFDFWFLIGFCFLIHLCFDWQLSDMSHSQCCFSSFRHQCLIHGVFDLHLGMTILKGPIPSMWPEKGSFSFCSWCGWKFCPFLKS